jgi:hypothetical protein
MSLCLFNDALQNVICEFKVKPVAVVSKRHCPTIFLETLRKSISARISAALTEVFRVFPQSLQENAGI